MTKHEKQYSSNEEFRKRFHIFRANMRKIKVMQETEQGTATYGATKFADLTGKTVSYIVVKFVLNFNFIQPRNSSNSILV
jgi:hypothetical protein